MAKHISIQSTVIPPGYNKEVATNRRDPRYAARFTRNYNAWAARIVIANTADSASMVSRLNEAKMLISA